MLGFAPMFRLALRNFDWPPPQPGIQAVSCSLLFPIVFTLLQMLQISHTNEQDCSGSGCSALLLPGYCAWCLNATLVTSDRRSLYCAGTKLSVSPSLSLSLSLSLCNLWTKQLPYHPNIGLFRCFNASWHNETTKIFLTIKKKLYYRVKEKPSQTETTLGSLMMLARAGRNKNQTKDLKYKQKVRKWKLWI